MTAIPVAATPMVAFPPKALHFLRDRVGAQALQEAGYAAGESIYGSFSAWLPGAAGVDDPRELAAPRLAEALSSFFSSLGWGNVTATPLGEAALAFDSADWAEAQPDAGLQYPGCYYTAGMMADFMSRLADAPLAVMEVACRSRGDAQCRWLVGSPDTLQGLYQHMAQGADYRVVLGAG